jgi:DNA-3-methyladenine glycosylase
MTTTPLGRDFFDRPAEEVAPDLLGRYLARSSPEGTVVLRITETEAYAGERDPASHAFRGRTQRNAVMFGPPGHAYVYFTYGMHFCVNLVCLGGGTAAAVLLRAGDFVSGRELARRRRPRARDRDLARGPARLCQALAIDRELNGADVCDPDGPLRVLPGEPVPPGPVRVRTGPRTGVNGAKDVPWRFWLDGEPSVSPYRLHTPRRRRAATPPG